jgi:hypothetical protein
MRLTHLAAFGKGSDLLHLPVQRKRKDLQILDLYRVMKEKADYVASQALQGASVRPL